MMAKPSVDQVKKFDTVTDKATKALTTATANLTKVMGDLGAQVEIVETLSEEIQVKQEQRDSLDKELGVKVREHEAELALQIRENEEKVVHTLLDKTGRADISREGLQTLRAELENLKDNQQDAVQSAVETTRRSAESQLAAIKSQQASAHAVETADLKANISSLESQVGYLTQQVNTYKEMLDNERVTREKVADASARAAEANRPVAPRN